MGDLGFKKTTTTKNKLTETWFMKERTDYTEVSGLPELFTSGGCRETTGLRTARHEHEHSNKIRETQGL